MDQNLKYLIPRDLINRSAICLCDKNNDPNIPFISLDNKIGMEFAGKGPCQKLWIG